MTKHETDKQKQLEQSALVSAKSRGHKMSPFQRLHEQKYISESVCERCEAYVQTNTRPQANQIDIGGTAVALNCDGN